MSTLHQNWQTTDGQPEQRPKVASSIRIDQEDRPTQPIGGQQRSLSRQPAAITGILLAISIGFGVFAGFGSIAPGRSADVSVHIHNGSFSPSSVTIAAGKTITWINDDQQPHTIQSDTLCTSDRRCLMTPPLEPGASTSLTVTDAIAAGTYTYYSINTEKAVGTVVIEASGHGAVAEQTHRNALQAALPSDTASSSVASDTAPDPFGSTIPPVVPEGSNTSTITVSSAQTSSLVASSIPSSAPTSSAQTVTVQASSSVSSAASLVAPAASSSSKATQVADTSTAINPPVKRSDPSTLIPVNPNTVGSQRAPNAATPQAKSTNEKLHGGAPLRTIRPISSPETGPKEWVAIFAAAGTLIIIVRKTLRKAMR